MSDGGPFRTAAGEAAPEGPARPTALIHDLGYKRYVGTRRPQSTRWRVLVKNVFATSWRGWWRMKIWVIGAAITTVAIGVPMYLSRQEMFEQLLKHSQVHIENALLPMAFRFFPWWGFVLAVTVAAGQVARDLRAGAFEFYFSRPVRPIDYVLGKLVGVWLVLATVMVAGPLLLALFWVGLSRSVDQLTPTLELVPKVLLVGLLGSLAFAAVPLAISSLSRRPRITTSMWAAFYILFGGVAEGLARVLQAKGLAALNLAHAVAGLAYGLFGIGTMSFGEVDPGVGASLAALIGYSGVALVVLVWRVRQAEQAGLGGG